MRAPAECVFLRGESALSFLIRPCAPLPRRPQVKVLASAHCACSCKTAGAWESPDEVPGADADVKAACKCAGLCRMPLS